MTASLERLGWSPWFAERFDPFARQGLVPARVAVSHSHLCRVLTPEGERDAALSGRLRHAARSVLDLPVTGDWVALAQRPAGERDSVRGLVPRQSAFVRAASGPGGGQQVLAANVDVALLLTGLDHDFSTRRLERYLALAWESGASPVVVLTKADLCEDVGSRRSRIEEVAVGVPVLVVSAVAGTGVASIESLLAPGRTLALLGSSGVGKSTLVNRLLGRAQQKTRAVREDDSRGRHTTTHRELVPLPGGALLIDTPGLREVGLAAGSGAEVAGFEDVLRLAAGCAFRDCRHEAEPRCAVREAVEAGRLPAERLASWQQLGREQRYADRRGDQRLRLEEQRRWKIIHKAARRHKPRG
jgi:ribosome biogenesis GTPase